MPRDLSANLPRTARLTFPGRPCGKATSSPDSWSADVALADASPANAGRGVDATWGLSDTCTAVYSDANPTVDPANKATLVALANRLAHDLWEWRTVGFDRAYAGIVAPDLGGLDDAAEWSYRADDCSTRLSTSADGEPDRFNHADPAHDCPDCVGVYGPALDKSGNQVVMRKYKLCLEGDEVRTYADGTDSFDGCCDSGTCTTYCVRVLDTLGAPVPGIAVTLGRRTGSTTIGFGTAAPVSGVTDSDGRFCYTLSTSTPENVGGATATIPMGGPTLSNLQPSRVGATCTFRYTLCHRSNVTTTIDGDSGAPISGVTLAGGHCSPNPPDWSNDPLMSPLSGQNCTQPAGGYPPWWIVDGPSHTRHQYLLQAIGPGGDVTGSLAYGYLPGAMTFLGGGTSCKAGYWGDCTPPVDTPCETQSASTVFVWPKEKYLLNPTGQCFGGRATVIRKTICMRLVAPHEVVGTDRYTLQWDPTSWDGGCVPPAGIGRVMRFDVVSGPGAATGSLQCSAGGSWQEATDVPYDSIKAEVVISVTGTSTVTTSASILPRWPGVTASLPSGTFPASCGAGQTRVAGGGHLDCPRPHTGPNGQAAGTEYGEQKPASLGAQANWRLAADTSQPAAFVGGYDATAPLVGGGLGSPAQNQNPYIWGCGVTTAATVRLTDGECGSGPYDSPDGPGDGDPAVAMMVLLHPGPRTEVLA